MKVLIVKMSALGDVIHALPVLSYLDQVSPGIEVDWVVEESFREILAGHPLLRRVHVTRTKVWRKRPLSRETRHEIMALVRTLRAAEYDIVFDIQGNIKSGVVTWLTHARRRYGFDREGVREAPNLLFTTNQIPLRRQDHHISARSLRVVSVPFGKDYPGVPLSSDIHTSAEDNHSAEALLATLSDGYVIVLHMGTTWPTKLWYDEGWITLGKALVKRFPDATLLFSWGNEGERRVAEKVAAEIGRNVRMLPKLSIKGFCALLKRVDLVIGGDTGPIHMAAAVGTPTVSLFRATDGRRNAPLGEHHLHVQSPLGCTACLRKACDKDAACRRSITVEMVLNAVGKIYGKKEQT